MRGAEALTIYFLGITSGIALVNLFALLTEPSAAEAGRDYAAYRACIERSSCYMTPQDWIDYYDLKWRLEESEIERTD